ncbi:hypothetical protein, partial [Acinetobacter baumannii]
TTYPSYALNLAQLGALCISNLCATKPVKNITKKTCRHFFLIFFRYLPIIKSHYYLIGKYYV